MVSADILFPVFHSTNLVYLLQRRPVLNIRNFSPEKGRGGAHFWFKEMSLAPCIDFGYTSTMRKSPMFTLHVCNRDYTSIRNGSKSSRDEKTRSCSLRFRRRERNQKIKNMKIHYRFKEKILDYNAELATGGMKLINNVNFHLYLSSFFMLFVNKICKMM